MRIPLTLNSIITVAITFSFSSLTLILLQSWIRYPLFIIEIIVMLAALVSLNTKDYRLNILRPKIMYLRSWEKFSELILTVISVQLLLLSILGLEGGLWRLALALIIMSFLSGFSIMKIVGIRKYFSALEFYILSFILSLSFSALLTLFSLNFAENNRPTIISFTFLLLGLLSLYNCKRRGRIISDYEHRSLSRNRDLLPISLVLAFYIFLIFVLYPSASLLPGTDVSRHINYSLVLYKTPEFYTSFTYILFHAFEAGFYTLSGINQSTSTILSTLALLTLFLPLCVYAVAKRFLSDIDRRIPSISLLLYCFTSGLTFLYYAEIIFTSHLGNTSEYSNVVQEVAEKSFFGIINFVQPVAFFAPLTVSFVILSMLILLLRNLSIPRWTFIIIFTVFIISVYFVHVPEAIIFVLLLGIYGFFSESKGLRLNDGLVASLIGYSIIGLYLVIAPVIGLKSGQGTLSSLIQITPLFFVVACLLWRWKILPRVGGRMNILQRKRTLRLTSYFLIVVYLGGIVVWILIDELDTLPIYELGAVPWFIYPIILGIVGILAIVSLRELTSQEKKLSTVNFLFAAIGFSLLIGKVITYVSASFVEVNYWERRLLLFIFLFSSFLAPLPLIRLHDYLNKIRSKVTANTIMLVVSCSIILCGFSSLAIQIEYWYVTATGNQVISNSEAEAVNYLKKVLHKDKYAFTAAPTSTSQHVLAFAAPVYQLPKSDLLFYSKYPAESLMSLNVRSLNHAYIYLHTRDIQALENTPDSWFNNYFLSGLHQVFSNKEVKIFNASAVAFPQPVSTTALSIPDHQNTNSWLYVYDMLYRSGLNYTEYYESDPNVFAVDDIILPVDHSSNFYYYDDFRFLNNTLDKQWKPISGNWFFSSSGLEGKGRETDAPLEHTILSPIYLRNGSISSLFEIKSINPDFYSYVSIITSWRDSKNYEFGGVVSRNNQLLTYFGAVREGKVSYEPSFPYLSTGIHWNPHTTLNLTISTRNDTQDLLLNGTKYLQRIHSSFEGPAGLTFSRAKDVLFYDFKVENNQRADDHEMRNLLKFVEDGGNLFVINSEGYGDFSKLLQTEQLSPEFRDLIRLYSNGSIGYVNGSLGKGSDVGARIFNASADLENFFMVESNLGKGRVTYINIHPQMSNGESLHGLFNVLFKTKSELFESNKLEINALSPRLREIPAFFTEMTGNGKIKISSDSIRLPPSDKYNIEINQDGRGTKTANGSTVSIMYVPGNVSLYSDNIGITNGVGLYTNLVFDDGRLIVDFDKDSVVEITNSSDSTIRLDKVSSLSLNSPNAINLYAKQPFFTINGNTSFEGFQGDRYVYSNYGIEEKSTKAHFEGRLNFSVPMSDRISLLDNIAYEGLLDSNKPIYNELSLIFSSKFAFNLYELPALVRVILLIPFILAVVFLFYKKIV